MMDRFELARRRMVEEQLVSRGIKDERVLSAMRLIPRHLFVGQDLQEKAYGDHALPIGERQTISQPYMVALMTEALDLNGDEKVLEIGTGSGYQTAILAELAANVYSIDRVKIFIDRTRKLLSALSYENVSTRCFDGTYGWKDQAPFDAILVAAGGPEIPCTLVEQLKIGGRLMIPVGTRLAQTLKRIVKEKTGIVESSLSPCVFVPLVGAMGWDPQEREE